MEINYVSLFTGKLIDKVVDVIMKQQLGYVVDDCTLTARFCLIHLAENKEIFDKNHLNNVTTIIKAQEFA